MFLTFWLPLLASGILVPLILGRVYPIDKNKPVPVDQPPLSTSANLIFVLGFNGMAVLVGWGLGEAIYYGLLSWHQSPAYSFVTLPEKMMFYGGAGFLMYGWVAYALVWLLRKVWGKEKADRFLATTAPDDGISHQKMEKHLPYYVGACSLIGAGILYFACTWYVKVGKDEIVFKLPFETEKKLAYQDIAHVQKDKNQDKQNISHSIIFKNGASFNTSNLQDKERLYEILK